MLQRIQTLYLLGVTILFVLVTFLPLSTLVTQSQELVFRTLGIYGQTGLMYSTWGLFVLALAIAIISLFTVFLFRRRMMQIRFTVFNSCLILGFYALFGFFAWITPEKLNAESLVVSLPLAFPIVALVFNWLAIRSIGADEALVRSLSRLR